MSARTGPPPRADRLEGLLRFAYSAALYLLTPITVYHLIWRGFRQAAYFDRWSERYASYDASSERTRVWVHAVSVGEVNAAVPLIDSLLRDRPDLRLLITTITPTGSARVEALWGVRVDHVYLPYDLPGAVARFLVHFRPSVALIMETELWPNLLFGCRDRGIPVYVLNARMSARSLRGYRVLAPLLRRVLRSVTVVAAQSAADAERFVALGAPAAHVIDTGNLKFDTTLPEAALAAGAARRARLGTRPVWIAASTHIEEEAAVLGMHRALRRRWPDLLMVWAPRHPERFRAAFDQACATGLRCARRSEQSWPAATDEVFVVDTLGELTTFYACADVAFVGGSLQPVGGHNLLEPTAAGAAVVSGPHLHNFSDISQRLLSAGALVIGQDATEIGDAIEALLADPVRRAAMVAAGRELIESGKGALQRTLALIEPALPTPGANTHRT